MRIDLGDIYLRLVEPDDASAMLDLLQRNREFLRPFEPRRPPEQWTVAAQRDLLVTTAERSANELEYGFGIFLTGDDLLIGRANLSNIVRKAFQNAYLGYFLDRAYNGRGYMTAGIDAVVDFAFGPARLHRVQAAVMPENVPSVRVVEKVGFRLEGFAPRYLRIDGEWRDHNLYALTTEDRSPSRRFL
jgi:[ribosomal protein S5]-alanine N-acetyltransferase